MSTFCKVIFRWTPRTPLKMSQYWFRLWLGAIRQQAITWANADPDLCPHMVSPGDSGSMSTMDIQFKHIFMLLKNNSKPWNKISVLPKVFWAPVLRTSGSWNLPVRMEGSLVRNFNNYYVLLIHVFDGCSNRLDPCDHSNLVCCCLSPVLIKGHVERFRKVSNPYDWMLKCSYRFKKKSISAAEMPVKFQSNWKTRKGLAENCDRTSYVILNQPQDLFSVQQTQVW